MENLAYGLVGVVAFLIFYTGWMSLQMKKIKSSTKKNKQDIVELKREIVLVKGGLIQARNIYLDVGVIENQAEENAQQIISLLNQEVGGLKSDIQSLEERLSEVEDEMPLK